MKTIILIGFIPKQALEGLGIILMDYSMMLIGCVLSQGRLIILYAINLETLEILDCVEPKVTELMNYTLRRPYTSKEIDMALKQMYPHKAPGLDGMNPFFYQCYWGVISPDVSCTILSILKGHAILPTMNHTFVALIPKKRNRTLLLTFTRLA